MSGGVLRVVMEMEPALSDDPYTVRVAGQAKFLRPLLGAPTGHAEMFKYGLL